MGVRVAAGRVGGAAGSATGGRAGGGIGDVELAGLGEVVELVEGRVHLHADGFGGGQVGAKSLGQETVPE